MARKATTTTDSNNGPIRLDPDRFGIRKYGKYDNPTWAIVGPSADIAAMFRNTGQHYVITTSRGRDMVIIPTGTVVSRKVDGQPVRIWLDENGEKRSAMVYNRVNNGKTVQRYDESAFD
jgi:hypothetical protein